MEPLPTFPLPPPTIGLATGPVLTNAAQVLHNKAHLSRTLRAPMDAVGGPIPVPGRFDTVLLDPRTTLVFGSDDSFFLHHDGRTLPFAFGPCGHPGFQRFAAVEWARSQGPAWARIAQVTWCLAPHIPTGIPESFLCPFWLGQNGTVCTGTGRESVVCAIESLVHHHALAEGDAAMGWKIDVFNARFDGATGALVPGFLTFDPGNVGLGNRGPVMGHVARVQRALKEDGRLDRLMSSHHLLVHAVGRDNAGRRTCGAHSDVATFRIRPLSAHQKMVGFHHLATLLDVPPQAFPAHAGS